MRFFEANVTSIEGNAILNSFKKGEHEKKLILSVYQTSRRK
jgi:hypothetical protein